MLQEKYGRDIANNLINKNFKDLDDEWKAKLINWMLQREDDRGIANNLIDKHFASISDEWKAKLIDWILQRGDSNGANNLINEHFKDLDSKWKVELIDWMLKRPADAERANNLINEHFANIDDEWKVKLIIWMLQPERTPEDRGRANNLINECFLTLKDKYKEELIKKLVSSNFIEEVKRILKTQPLKINHLRAMLGMVSTLDQVKQKMDELFNGLEGEVQYLKDKTMLSILFSGDLTEEEHKKAINSIDNNTFNEQAKEDALSEFREIAKNKFSLLMPNYQNLVYLNEHFKLNLDEMLTGHIPLSFLHKAVKNSKIDKNEIFGQISKLENEKQIDPNFRLHFKLINWILENNTKADAEKVDKDLIEVVKYIQGIIKESNEYKSQQEKEKVDEFFTKLLSEKADDFFEGKLYRKDLAGFLSSFLTKYLFEKNAAIDVLMATSLMNNCGAGKAQMAFANSVFNGEKHENSFLVFFNDVTMTSVSELTENSQSDLNHLKNTEGVNDITYCREFQEAYINVDTLIENLIRKGEGLSYGQESGAKWTFLSELDGEARGAEDMFCFKLKEALMDQAQLQAFEERKKLYAKLIDGTLNLENEQEEIELSKLGQISEREMVTIVKCFLNDTFELGIEDVSISAEQKQKLSSVLREMKSKYLEIKKEKEEKELKEKKDSKEKTIEKINPQKELYTENAETIHTTKTEKLDQTMIL
jgi:hypothetical protein